jgi:aminomethyltransferase
MRKTPLHDAYADQAKVVDFHGWALPIQFEGIVKEHQHTRAAAGLFDCSHMGEFLLKGENSIRAFDKIVFSDMVTLKPGRCRYSCILNDDGGIIDDCVGLKLAEDELYLITNAAPLEKVNALLQDRVPEAIDVTEQTAKIDLQGPRSRDILLDMGLEAIAPLKFWNGTRARWLGIDFIVARAGYTGELGYELYLPAAQAAEIWQTLLAHDEVRPCGLGARDTLRTEMGYPLNGEDVNEETSPLEADMRRFIAWERAFPGRERMKKMYEKGDYKVLTSIVSATRRAPRPGFEVKKDGVVAGRVTSGTFGPSIGRGVGLAYVPLAQSAGGHTFTAGPRDLAIETVDAPVYKEGTARRKIDI